MSFLHKLATIVTVSLSFKFKGDAMLVVARSHLEKGVSSRNFQG